MGKTQDNRIEPSISFYEKLVPFLDFSGVTDLSNYTALPDNWILVMADIKGSTKAINQGRYKDVNLMGAGCITAILNVTRGYEIPYVFGGDGATLAIPAEALPRVKNALLGVQQLAGVQFSLELRIGAVPIEKIRALGNEVLIAKYQLSEGNYLAMFAGGGVEKVDQLIKDETNKNNFRFNATVSEQHQAHMDGLSCRWEPLRSRRGFMASILVQAQPNENKTDFNTYNLVIEKIATITGSDETIISPVHQDNLRFKWPPKGMKSEIKLSNRRGFDLYKESLIQWVLEKFNLSAGGYDAPKYRQELRTNSDFRRFDDTLRLVLDCEESQIDGIDAYLSELHDQGLIVYGIHIADSALMTCLVFNHTQGEHIHFIDGANGGFAVAAAQMKAQLKIKNLTQA